MKSKWQDWSFSQGVAEVLRALAVIQTLFDGTWANYVLFGGIVKDSEIEKEIIDSDLNIEVAG